MHATKLLFSFLILLQPIYFCKAEAIAFKRQDDLLKSLYISSKLSLKIPWDDISDADADADAAEKIGLCSGKYNLGIRLNCKDCQFRIFTGMSYHTFSEYTALCSNLSLSALSDEINSSWGTSLSLLNATGIPLSFKAGNLLFSGCFSLLKNPQFSSVHDPFRSSFNTETSLVVSLPSSSSSDALTSFSASFDMENSYDNKIDFFSINGAYCTDGTSAASIKFGVQPFKTVKFETVVSGGYFYLTPPDSETWFSDNPYFTADWYEAAVCSLSEISPHSKIRLTMGFHKNPFSQNAFWFRNENIFSLNGFVLQADFFATDIFLIKLPLLIKKEYADVENFFNSGSIVCADSSILDTHFQAIFRPSYTLELNNESILRIGAESYTMLEEISKSHFAFTETCYGKIRYSSEREKRIFSVQTAGGIKDVSTISLTTKETKDPKAVVSTSITETFRNFDLDLSLSGQRQLTSDKTVLGQNLRLSFRPKNSIFTSFYVTESIEYKTEENQLTDLTVSFSAKKKFGKTSFLFKFNIANKF